jgi:hypothetical protein
MKNLLSLFIILFTFEAMAVGRIDLSYGFYSLNSKASNKTTSTTSSEAAKSAAVSGPYLFNLAYLLPVADKVQVNLGYSVLLADIAGTDKGYGLNVGFNYFILGSAKNENLKNDAIDVERFEIWKPYTGMSFYQRDFQSIKNSYAGFGINGGVERYYTKDVSFKGELRYISLSGTNSAIATEINAIFGIILVI